MNVVIVNLTAAPEPSLGLGYLAACLRRYCGIAASVLEGTAYSPSAVAALCPDIVGFSAYSYNYPEVVAEAENLGRCCPSAIMIVGGSHITSLPDDLAPVFLAGVIGEGGATLVEMVARRRVAGKLTVDELGGIRGIVYRDRQGKICMTPSRPVVEELDILPPPDRKILDNARYMENYDPLEINVPMRGTNLITSRGCFGRCRFCVNGLRRIHLRRHSPARVVREISELVSTYRAEAIFIRDDVFADNLRWLKRCVAALATVGIADKVRFHVHLRADMVEPERLALFDAMNVRSVSVGFESASTRVLRFLKNSAIDASVNQRAVDLLIKYRMNIIGLFMLGTYGETEQEMCATVEFFRRNPIKTGNFSITQPLPGTELGHMYRKMRGRLKADSRRMCLPVNRKSDFHNVVYFNDVVPRKRFEEIYLGAREMALKRYFNNDFAVFL